MILVWTLLAVSNFYIPLVGSHPEKMPHEHREADGQGSRAQASVAPLIGHSKDADDKLQGEEDLHGGGHAQADAWLQLKDQRGERKSDEINGESAKNNMALNSVRHS